MFLISHKSFSILEEMYKRNVYGILQRKRKYFVGTRIILQLEAFQALTSCWLCAFCTQSQQDPLMVLNL